ncbi:STM4014 family protein [Rubellicoccus peritrichatus]|uniref:STM4014 family protein n=1 Tax=Rubellicoccus peritrichatus TaxID=3080537 RepID=A0AAQ3L8Q5_9BACT|nr:STM4014 family protein [Puniceicoccus sp. CR14]WOO39355.1 STM4014 family protein [Puniceicoccus sp. CR14]
MAFRRSRRIVILYCGMQFGLLGNPENRRVAYFAAACKHFDLPPPLVFSWQSYLESPESIHRLMEKVDFMRMDSPAENASVTKKLIELGNRKLKPTIRFGQITWLKEYYMGFSKILDILSEQRITWMNSPSDIRIMFDKWASHQRFKQKNLPRPATELVPESIQAFRDKRSQEGRIFLKPLYASSASGVCAYQWSDKNEQLIGPIEIVKKGAQVILYNSLRVRKYNMREDIDAILQTLLPQCMLQEAWLPKAKVDGKNLDLRIVVIAGKASHWVIRQSSHPMTNLHLGNTRGNREALINVHGPKVLEDCFSLAEQAAACFRNSLYAGVDIMFNRRGQPYVLEINAFGDLLPGILHEGLDTYTTEVKALRSRVS